MARNRKSSGGGFRLGPLVWACLLCLFIGGSGVGYVWQKAGIDQLGREIKARETQLRGLINKNEAAKRQLGAMRSPPVLEMRNKELNLGLVMPQPEQILRLVEPDGPQAPAEQKNYAENREWSPGANAPRL